MSLLPFDQTGNLASNLKTEQHVISSANGIDYAYIVPEWAPFYKKSFAIYHVESSRYLTEGVDFEFTHDFVEAYERLAAYIYGSVTILDTTLVGTFQLKLQSLGGDFVTSTTQAIQNGFAALLEVQSTTWDSVVMPETFPPTMHEIPLSDIEGVTEIINQLVLMREALNAGVSDIKLEDVTDLESKFTSVLLTNLEDIALAIREKEYSNSLYFEESVIKEEITDVPYVEDTWTDLPMALILTKAGSFNIDWNVDAETNTKDGKVSFRWKSNDSVISKSYNKNVISSHAIGTALQLQAYVTGSTGNKLRISEVFSGANFRATRIGN